MTDFERTTRDDNTVDTLDLVRAVAHLPGIDIEVARWRCADAEHVSINLKAMPSFDAVTRAFEAANPFAFWMRSAELAWLPWLAATRALMRPWALLPTPQRPGDRGK